MQYIALDVHKRYSLASVEHSTGGIIGEAPLTHAPGAIQQFLAQCVGPYLKALRRSSGISGSLGRGGERSIVRVPASGPIASGAW